MEVETKIILTALRNFLDRDEVKNKKITAKMPNDPRLGDLSGKEVEMPLTTVFQGLTHKIGFKDMAKVLDENYTIVRIFLVELRSELDAYLPFVEDSDVSIKDKGKAVDDVADDLSSDVDDSSDVSDDDAKEDIKDLEDNKDEDEQVKG